MNRTQHILIKVLLFAAVLQFAGRSLAQERTSLPESDVFRLGPVRTRTKTGYYR
ncbi:MAG: hypothetical protein ACM3SW_20860 [Actinomycetota bacterium]